GGARLLEVDAHDDPQVHREGDGLLLEPAGIVQGRRRIVHRARSDHGDQSIVVSFQDADDLVAGTRDHLGARLGQRQLLQQDRRGNQRAVALDVEVAGLHRRRILSGPGAKSLASPDRVGCLRAARDVHRELAKVGRLPAGGRSGIDRRGGARGRIFAQPRAAQLHPRRSGGAAAARGGIRRWRAGARSHRADGHRPARRGNRGNAGPFRGLTMDTLHVGTRKGLFTLRGADIARVSFLGAPVTAVLSRDGALHAAVGHGHFGAKLHRSRDGGETWEEIAPPRWPEKPADADDRNPMSGAPWPWTLDQISILEPDPPRPEDLWCGTIPGGLFHSPDGGASWRLVRSLWDRPERKQWFGGGYDFPGIPSITVDPRDPRR